MGNRQYLKKHHDTWHVVVEIPKNLRERAGGKRRFKRSLKTGDLGEANRLKHAHVAEFNRRIEALKKEKPDRLAPLMGAALQFRDALEHARAEGKGVQVEQIDAHFHLEPPAYPLMLSAYRTRSIWGHKSPGERLEITHPPVTDALAEQVRAINTFLTQHRIEGGVHYGFFRGFNNGNVEGFDWKWGGRLYSIGSKNYQQDSGDQRALMTIDGQPMVET